VRAKLWQLLGPEPPGPPFDPDAHLAELPDAAVRYFRHAIHPGTPLQTRAELEMSGQIKAGGGWMGFRATERIAPHSGFAWRVRARRGPILIRGEDWYAEGEGGLQMRLFGLVPVARASGPDVSRSAAGRLAVEAVWVPASLLPLSGAAIEETPTGFTAAIELDGSQHRVAIAVGEDGRVTDVSTDRWGDVGADGRWREVPFGGRVLAEADHGGHTIPSELSVGWRLGGEREAEAEFFRARIDRASFLAAG